MGFLHVGEGESVEATDWCLTLSLQWRGEYLDGNVWKGRHIQSVIAIGAGSSVGGK